MRLLLILILDSLLQRHVLRIHLLGLLGHAWHPHRLILSRRGIRRGLDSLAWTKRLRLLKTLLESRVLLLGLLGFWRCLAENLIVNEVLGLEKCFKFLLVELTLRT